MGFSRQKYWIRFPYPPRNRIHVFRSYCIAGRFFTTDQQGSPPLTLLHLIRNHVLQILPHTTVQLLSRVQLFVSPWTAARQASLSITNSQSLRKLMSVKSVMLCITGFAETCHFSNYERHHDGLSHQPLLIYPSISQMFLHNTSNSKKKKKKKIKVVGRRVLLGNVTLSSF